MRTSVVSLGEEGRRFSQDLDVHLQPRIVLAELLELLQLGGAELGCPSVRLRRGLLYPPVKRALRDAELVSNLRGRLAASLHELHRFPLELRAEHTLATLRHLSPHSGS